MPVLTDYLDVDNLKQLQDAFCATAGVSLRICDSKGRSLVEESVPAQGAEVEGDSLLDEAPVVIEDKIVGCVCVLDGVDSARARPFVRLMADMIGRLCEQRNVLRTRMIELGALYRLTTEFTGLKDLQSVMDMATKTVVRTLKAKACTIRLLNEDGTELQIKSAASLSPEYLNKGPILLSDSKIDRKVIRNRKSVYIADMQNDPRVLYPKEAKRERIVSALCAPLVYKDKPEGVIRVYTKKQKEFNWFERSLLKAIAANAAAALVNARLYQQAVEGVNIKRQLRLASVVQRRMIPKKPPVRTGFDIGAVYVPCFELGGDFYDFIDLGQDNLALTVCDVVGKGVRASLLMASLRASLRAHADNIYDMSEMLGKVNYDLCECTISSDFATLFYMVLNTRTRQLTYSNAGHPPAFLFRDGKAQRLTAGGSVLGVIEFSQWNFDAITCRSGDVILMYTDGLSEAINFKDEAFGYQRIEEAAMEAIELGRNADGIARHVLWKMRNFAGLTKRFDDLTIVTTVIGD